jgi:hypothetical protein
MRARYENTALNSNIQLSPFVPKYLPPPKPNYKSAKGGSGFGPHEYLKRWNRNDAPPTTPGKAAILQARYEAARLSVAPTLHSKSNPPPVGKIIIVDKKKAQKLKKQRVRSRKALKAKRRNAEKLEKKRNPIVL